MLAPHANIPTSAFAMLVIEREKGGRSVQVVFDAVRIFRLTDMADLRLVLRRAMSTLHGRIGFRLEAAHDGLVHGEEL